MMKGILVSVPTTFVLVLSWCLPAPGVEVTIDFSNPDVVWLASTPYYEDGFRFEDVLDGTGHVAYGYMALGDWMVSGDWIVPGVLSQIKAEHEAGLPFTLNSLEYLSEVHGDNPGQIEFASSKGGLRTVTVGDPPDLYITVDFSEDPQWQSISWFTLSGVVSLATDLNEAVFDNIEIDVIPEPSSLLMVGAGLVLWLAGRFRRSR